MQDQAIDLVSRLKIMKVNTESSSLDEFLVSSRQFNIRTEDHSSLYKKQYSMMSTPSVFAKSFLCVPKQTMIIYYQLLLLSLLLFLLSVPENLELILFAIYRVLISRMTGNYSQFGLELKICVKFVKMRYGLFVLYYIS